MPEGAEKEIKMTEEQQLACAKYAHGAGNAFMEQVEGIMDELETLGAGPLARRDIVVAIFSQLMGCAFAERIDADATPEFDPGKYWSWVINNLTDVMSHYSNCYSLDAQITMATVEKKMTEH